MYIETRFYDNGKAEAKLHRGFGYPKLDDGLENCDFYLETINSHPGHKVQPSSCMYGEEQQAESEYDYETLEDWIEENLEIELDDIVPLVLDLEAGDWVGITDYV